MAPDAQRARVWTDLSSQHHATRDQRLHRAADGSLILTRPSPIAEAFARLRRDDPDRRLIYLPGSDTAVSAAGLAESAARVTSALDTARIGPGQVILSAVGNVALWFGVFLACRARGNPLLPLDAGTTAAEIAVLATQFDAAALIAPAGRDVPAFAASVPVAPGMTLRPRPGAAAPFADGNVAVLKLTSGTSGRPRATVASESALVSDGETLAGAMDIRPGDIQIAAIPLSHSYGIGNLVMPLLLQGTAISLRDTFVPQQVPHDARRVHARHLPGAPYMFDHLVAHPPPDGWPPSLTRLVSAGAPLDPVLARSFHTAFGVKIHPFYGTSETGGIAFDDSETPVEEGVVGKALPGVEISLVPAIGGPSGSGRVRVRSAAVSRGYAGDADADAFVDGGFLTSDLATLDASGRLTLVGRLSSFVNVAGRKVQPEEVERALREFPRVNDVRVFGTEDPIRGERLIACLVVSGDRPSMLELRKFCAGRLAAHKIPRAFVFVDEIPLTVRGKTDRSRLIALARAEMARAGML